MSNHLSLLNILAFRGLRGLRLEGLGTFNLFVGENNSGKTSILEAILLAFAPGDRDNWEQVFALRGASWDLPTRKARWLFPVSESEPSGPPDTIQIESSFGDIQESLAIRYGEVSQEKSTQVLRRGGREIPEEIIKTVNRLEIEWTGGNEGTKSGTIICTDTTHSVSRRWGWHRSSDGPLDRMPVRKLAFMAPRSHHRPEAVAEAVSSCVESGTKQELLPFIQIFDSDITDLDVVVDQGHSDVLIQHRRLGSLPLHAFGDGMAKALHVAATAFDVAGGTLLLDEVETSLHFSAQAPFFKALRRIADSLDVQIFATTHSLESLDSTLAAFEDNEDDLVAYRIAKKDGASVVTAYPGHLLRETRYEMGFEIR
jgi:hypothetical protein